MKVIITENNEITEVSVEIHCAETDSDILKLRNFISNYDEHIEATCEGETLYVDLSEILYFESVDNKTFLYTEDRVLGTSMKLYELELRLSDKDFFRCSKSVILNLRKVKKVKPEMTRNILVTLSNEEIVVISRRYAQAFKKLLEEA